MRSTKIALGLCASLAAPAGFANGNLLFNHEWTFAHTTANQTAAFGAEILSFDSLNERLWVVGANGVDVLNLAGQLQTSIDLSSLGGANSVAIANNRAAVAISAPLKTDAGVVRFFDATNFNVLDTVTVGANPDSVTFTPDGSKLLVANEGEPTGYLAGDVDPVGSVDIINATTFARNTAEFNAFNGSAGALKALGVRLNGPGATVAQDVEPEYIAVSADGATAVVTLQEANAVATVDIASSTVTNIVSMGLKRHNVLGNGLDVSDRDGPGNNAANGNIQNWNVFGTYMPDAIAGFVSNGDQFYVTANEGDGRDWNGFKDEIVVGAATIDPLLNNSLSAAHGADWKTNNDKLSRLTVSTTGDLDGDGDLDRLESFGGRSFSILDEAGNLVFDSGDDIEAIIAADFPGLWVDGRSDNKGPEPESVVVGTLGDMSLLFLGLERSNAVMVWDLTDVNNITFIDMLFTSGDTAPEGLSYFTLGNKGYLGVANEGGGTTTLYSISAVPVPAAVWMMGSALVGLAWRRRQA